MKKIIIALLFVPALFSCSDDYIEDKHEKVWIDQSDGVLYGKECIRLSFYDEQLHLPKELKDKYDKYPYDLFVICECLRVLSEQESFCDSVGETEEWYFFLEWYYKNF